MGEANVDLILCINASEGLRHGQLNMSQVKGCVTLDEHYTEGDTTPIMKGCKVCTGYLTGDIENNLSL
jgi:hypothetical protein